MVTRSICSVCKHFFSHGESSLFRGNICKAFPEGAPIPYGDNYTWGSIYPISEHEMELRFHRILSPIQENNYLYENKDDFYNKPNVGGKFCLSLEGLYSFFHSELYPTKSDSLSKAIEVVQSWFAREDIYLAISSKEEAMEWILSRNQSQEAQMARKDFSQYSKPIDILLSPDYVREPDEDKVKRLFGCVEKHGFPKDFCVPYDATYFHYVYDFLCLNLGVVMSDLGEISMKNKGISVLPDSVGELTNVRFLDISRNQLRTLPAAVGKLQFLERLDVYGNQLEALPDEVCNLLRMNRLDLYHNALVALPAEIGKLENLQWLGLNHNKLTSLPASMTNLQKLEGLYCTDNELTDFPESLSTLGNLQYLYLSRNQLTSLPATVGKVQGLRWLGLGGNQLTTLPEELFALPALEWLDLRDNPIAESEQERIKAGLPKVEVLF